MTALLTAVFVATAYCHTGTTASGLPAGPGRIAADPRVLPLGTRVFVDGYGPAVVADTGGDIVGQRIDVWLGCDQARQWGRQSVGVTLLGAAPPADPPVAVERAVYPDGDRWIEVTRWRAADGNEWDAFVEVPAP